MSSSARPTSTVLPRGARTSRWGAGGVLGALVLAVVPIVSLTGSPDAVPVSVSPPDVAPGRVLVRFEPGTATEVRAGLRDRLHARPVSTLAGLGTHVWAVARGTERAAVAALAHDPHVVYVERDVVRTSTALPDDPYLPTGSGSYYGGQWDVFRTRTSDAWAAAGYGSSTTVVAVVDSGVASAHPDLRGQLVPGRNVLDGSTSTEDTDGHGTEVAGVIAAATDNALGIAGICGGCRVMPVKVTSGGSAYDSNLAAGVTWAADHGARVVNLSFAGAGSTTTLADAIAYARGKGVVVVAAAGNSGCDCPTYPASYPGVVSVGASSNATGDPLQGYSNYGSWVDVAAPSGNVTTSLTDPATGTAWGWMPVGGTSMAAPVVAGVAGLLISARPTASAADVVAALTAGADPVSGTHPVATGRLDTLDALGAITGSQGATPSPTAPAASSPSPTPATSPSPTTSPSTATPTPTASSSPPPAATTQTFSGTLNRKQPARSFSVPSASTVSTSTTFGCPSLSVDVAEDASSLAAASGPSVLRTAPVAAHGPVTVTVSGSAKCSFSLSVTTT